MSSKTKTAMIMAGGTGGHIFPGLAVAQQLQQNGWDIHWIGTADRMEAQLVPSYDLPIHFIDIKGVRGNGIKRLLTMPFMLIKAWWQALKIMKTVKPTVVLGFGGYASAPGGIAAKSLGLPLFLHEQNAVLGMSNKWLAKVANHLFLAFAAAKPVNKTSGVSVIGNPVRSDISALNAESKRELNQDSQFRILVIGGSLGARVLNQNLPKIFSNLTSEGFKVSVQHQVGKGNKPEVDALYQHSDTADLDVEVNEFIDDMPAALKWADLVVCRAGALTVSELAASGNAGIFVPLPHAVDDHQTANANSLVEVGAGRLVKQSGLNETLPKVLAELLSEPASINQMQQQAKQQANLSTTDTIVSFCQKWN